MYTSLFILLIFSTTKYYIWAFEEFYGRPNQGIRDQDHFGPNSPGIGRHNEDQRSSIDPNRHVHTSSKGHIPENERLRSGPTTVRNYIESASSNAKRYFNSSDQNISNNNNNKRRSQAYEDTDRMLYPSDVENFTAESPVKIRSRNCSYGLCDDVDDYPIEKIQRILSRSELKKFFSSEVPLGSRFGETTDNLCSTISHTRFPKTAKNMQNKEQVIVNVDQYKQGVVFETCKDEGPCNYSENFPNNFTPQCEQKYTVRKLMVVQKESEGTVFDDFKIPSCCVCVVKK